MNMHTYQWLSIVVLEHNNAAERLRLDRERLRKRQKNLCQTDPRPHTLFHFHYY